MAVDKCQSCQGWNYLDVDTCVHCGAARSQAAVTPRTAVAAGNPGGSAIDSTPVWWLAAIVVAMLLYPPWEFVRYRSSRVEQFPGGYSWIWQPPEVPTRPSAYPAGTTVSVYSTVRIDTQRLVIQMVGVAAIAAAGVASLLLSRRN